MTELVSREYAFQLLDYVAEKKRIITDDDFFKEARAELIKLVDNARQSDRFWHDRYMELAKEVMSAAGLPTDFKEHGLQEAFAKLKDLTPEHIPYAGEER